MHGQRKESTRVISIILQACILGSLAFALLPIAIADAVIVATRSARITAPGVPQSVIGQLLDSSGVSLKYKDHAPDRAFVSHAKESGSAQTCPDDLYLAALALSPHRKRGCAPRLSQKTGTRARAQHQPHDTGSGHPRACNEDVS